MKRFPSLPMILFLLLALAPIANARSLPIPSETVLTVLDRQVSQTVKDRLCNREVYDETGITELSPEGMPILRIYYGNLAFYSELSLEQALTSMAAESDGGETYLLFGEDTVYCATPVSVRNTEKL